jgi:hypothetical protein
MLVAHEQFRERRIAGAHGAVLLGPHEVRRRVLDAVVDLRSRGTPGEGHEDGAEPLARPVELHRFVPVRHYGGEPVTSREAERLEACGQPRGALAQSGVREPDVSVDQRFPLRVALRGVRQAQGEVHEVPATCAIAFTIGS